MKITEAIKQQAKLIGDVDTLFECDDWCVSVSRGVVHKASDTDVSWDEIERVRTLDVKTIHTFEEQPWPFWGKNLQPDWFFQGSYKAAMCYAVGYLTIAAWNLKAKAHCKTIYPN
jgi:hypothetical protein